MFSRSLKYKATVTCAAGFGFFLLYEATPIDSRSAAGRVLALDAASASLAGPLLPFDVTAYCRGVTTASGAAVRSGIAAADPDVLPVGSVIQLDALDPAYNGVYTVMDTGPQVQGNTVDIYVWNCDEAVRFGRRSARLRVLRLGWSPRATGDRANPLLE